MFYNALEDGPQIDKVTTDNYLFTAGLRGNLGEFADAWDILKTWQWETGIRWNEDSRVEKIGGVVNNNALRTALLDTNPATAFNPFGLSQNNKFVKDRVYTIASQFGSVQLLTGRGGMVGRRRAASPDARNSSLRTRRKMFGWMPPKTLTGARGTTIRRRSPVRRW